MSELAIVSLGSLAQWTTVALMLIVAWRLSAGGAGTAVQELSKANEVLTKRVHELGSEVRDLRVENAKLRQRTDFHAVLGVFEERAEERMARMEQRADERAEKMLKVLELIADRLGSDDNHRG